MPDQVPAISKVEEKLAVVIGAYLPFAGTTVVADAKPDEAIDPNSIVIYTTSYRVDQSEEQGQSRHTATIEFEAVNARSPAGTISRRNQVALANVVGALAQDRTLGGMVEDIQEVDVAPLESNGRDRGAASLQSTVTFYTPRDDWFTIIGAGGAQF